MTHTCESCGSFGDALAGELPIGWYTDIFTGGSLCDDCMLSPRPQPTTGLYRVDTRIGDQGRWDEDSAGLTSVQAHERADYLRSHKIRVRIVAVNPE